MNDIFDPATVLLYLPKLLYRLPVTLLIVLAATAAGVLLGGLLGFCRLYRLPVLSQAALLYTSFMRGTPVIVQLFLVYYGLPIVVALSGLNINRWNPLFFVIVAYALHVGAFYAEIFRAAIGSVPAGQAEAAYSVGLSRVQAFRRIVAPQAVLIAVPGFGAVLSGLLQDTSLAFTVGIVDVMGEVRAIGANTNRMLEGYAGAAIIFLFLTLLLEGSFSHLEKRLRVMRHR